MIREKLLLRQYDLLLSQSHKIAIDDIKFLRDNENDVLNSIKLYGKFNIDHHKLQQTTTTTTTTPQNQRQNQHHNQSVATDGFIIETEDYICPNIDHDFMYKCLNESSGGDLLLLDDVGVVNIMKENKNKITTDPTGSLIKDNANFINESIINITLNESKELIDQTNNKKQVSSTVVTTTMTPMAQTTNNKGITGTSPISTITVTSPSSPLLLIDEGLFGSSGDVLLTTKPIKNIHHNHNNHNNDEQLQKSLKNISNLTINNCTGNINLKNISNLTINTSCKETSLSQLQQQQQQPSSSSMMTMTMSTSSTLPSSPQSIINNNAKPEDIECNFYNRLLTETKLIKSLQLPKTLPLNDNNNHNHHNLEFKKNIFNNLDHPIQVQQWLKQIIYQTDVEPIQTIEILEHSKIDG